MRGKYRRNTVKTAILPNVKLWALIYPPHPRLLSLNAVWKVDRWFVVYRWLHATLHTSSVPDVSTTRAKNRRVTAILNQIFKFWMLLSCTHLFSDWAITGTIEWTHGVLYHAKIYFDRYRLRPVRPHCNCYTFAQNVCGCTGTTVITTLTWVSFHMHAPVARRHDTVRADFNVVWRRYMYVLNRSECEL